MTKHTLELSAQLEAPFLHVAGARTTGVRFDGTPHDFLPAAGGVIHPDIHRFSYDRMGATVTVAEGASHVVMLSRPAVVAGVVREAVRSCAPGGLHS
jgi:pimeloyl-ACP methyl ester carboxylesterase